MRRTTSPMERRNVSISSITGILSGLAGLPLGLSRIASQLPGAMPSVRETESQQSSVDSIFADDKLTQDEFRSLLAEILSEYTGEAEESSSPALRKDGSAAESDGEAAALADQLGGALFGMIDRDGNGSLEGQELEFVRSALWFLNPELFNLLSGTPTPPEEAGTVIDPPGSPTVRPVTPRTGTVIDPPAAPTSRLRL